ncbi:MAG: hypothetical protein JNL46_07285 [Sphingosinicella sp.]|jgi:hypothetical protein|nr:hypothetical protein [Sphingosinicella sp.]
MDWGSPFFVLAIIAISTGGWLISTWIRARHGYPIENEFWGTTDKSAGESLAPSRKTELLANENAEMKGQIARLEERITVLERIATDRSRRLSDEIESLR